MKQQICSHGLLQVNKQANKNVSKFTQLSLKRMCQDQITATLIPTELELKQSDQPHQLLNKLEV